MDTVECLKKVDSYLASDSFRQPLFICVNSREDLRRLKKYLPPKLTKLSVADFCYKPDENPSIDGLLHQLAIDNRKMLLFDLIPALELLGKTELKKTLSTLLSLPIRGKLIVFCFQGMRYFKELKDPRIERRLIQVDGKMDKNPRIIFWSGDVAITQMLPQANSIKELIPKIENTSDERIFVITKKKKRTIQIHSCSLLNGLVPTIFSLNVNRKLPQCLTSVLVRKHNGKNCCKKLLRKKVGKT